MPGVSVVNPSNSKNNIGTTGRRQQPESRRNSEQVDELVMQHVITASSSSRHDRVMCKVRASTSKVKERSERKLELRDAKEENKSSASSGRVALATEKGDWERGNIDMSDRTGYVDKRRSSRSKSARRTRSLSHPRKERNGGDEEARGEHLHHGQGRRSPSRNSKEVRSRVTWSTKPESLSSSERSAPNNRCVDEVAASLQQQLAVIPKKKRAHSKKERNHHQNHAENNTVSVYSKPVIHIDRMDRVVPRTLSQVCV